MSHVKDISQIFLAQPYSPHLFRQGVLPGPDLLMKVLRDEITPADAKRLWKEDEDSREKQRIAAKTIEPEKWSRALEIPCRRCTDENGGVEKRKPISAFTSAHLHEDTWRNVIRKGQDLCCFKCGHAQGCLCS